MRAFFKALATDCQGRSVEQAVISMVGAAVFFGLEIYAVGVHGQNFDAFGFGAGMGTLLGATSAGFGLRARWTPDVAASVDQVTGRLMEGAP